MPRKYYYLIETIAGLALVVLIDHFFVPGSSGFVNINPHPYWIVILLIACRYGTIQGLFAGMMAAIAYYLLASLSPDVDFKDFTFPHGPFKLPFFFILVGGVLGEIRNLHKKLYDKLQDKFDDTVKDLDSLAVEHTALTNSKTELEKRIALQSSTMLNLFERLINIEQLAPEELFGKIPELLKEQLNAACSSVYLLKDNKLRLHTRKGDKIEDLYPENLLPDTVALNDGIMGEVVEKKKLITINQMITESTFSDFSRLKVIMSAPVLRKDESLVGIINVERIPFFDYNVNSIRVFEMLAYWVSIVVDHAMQFQQFKDKNIIDEITGAHSYIHFQKRLGYEIARARRFHSPLSLLLLDIKYFDQMQVSEKKNVLVVLNWIFTHVLREVDIIAKFKNESTFAIILPGQTSLNAEKVSNRLSDEIDNYRLQPFEDKNKQLEFKISMSTLQISEGSYDSLTQTAEERLEKDGMLNLTDVHDDIKYLLNINKLDTDGFAVKSEK